MTRNQNHDDDASSSSSSRKRIMTLDNGDMGTWSDVNHDVLFLVMMQLGFVDFFAFSGVCKSWRLFALSNRNTFMASKPPMFFICMTNEANKNDWCHLKDFEDKKLKTTLPHFAGSVCVGSTCGYLILYARETRDLWLVNPITRHELHFPDYPLYVRVSRESMRGVLVFSPSISGWVFFVLCKKISYYIAGKRGWNHVSSTLPIIDLHFFKGKIYTLHANSSLGEVRVDLKRKHRWTLLETKNLPNLSSSNRRILVSSGEKLYVYGNFIPGKVMELDFGEMKWVSVEKTIGEYAFFISWYNYSAAIKPESWADPRTKYKSCDYIFDTDKSQQCRFIYQGMWYFSHDCLNVNLLDE